MTASFPFSRQGKLPYGLSAFVIVLAVIGCRTETPSRVWTHGDATLSPGPEIVISKESVMTGSSHDALRPPPGMVFVPGGQTIIGSHVGPTEEQPVFKTTVDPFYLDTHPVTVAQFRTFVEKTGYVTEAERFGNSGVFNFDLRTWELRKGATWSFPLGADAPAAAGDHPVTHVSWNDASEYARWAGKRLPTEVEWEFAARSGSDRNEPYPWGSSTTDRGEHRANTWQGVFPLHNTGEDGFVLTSPVGTFHGNVFGLYDMVGNVWEWTSDWYRPYEDYKTEFIPKATSERVQRGGSFLCNESYCHGFRVTARGHSTPESSHFHVGFRCASDTPARS